MKDYFRIQRTGFFYATRLVLLIIVTTLISGCQHPATVPLSYAESNLAYTSYVTAQSDREVLWVLNTLTGRMNPILGTQSAYPAPFTWSPDGRFIAFGSPSVDSTQNESGYSNVGIYILNAEGQTSAFKSCSVSPAWSPDGNYIAYIDHCSTISRLKIARVNGMDERTLVDKVNDQMLGAQGEPVEGARLIGRLSWSPDGFKIAYEDQNVDGTWSIWLVDVVGGQPYQLTVGRYPAWSPEGQQIAFCRNGQVWTVDVNSGVEGMLLSAPFEAQWPAWSPDGQQLALVAARGETYGSIYVVNADGSNLKRVTFPNQGEESNNYPEWKPVGTGEPE